MKQQKTENMIDNNIQLRNIWSLSGHNFFIPDYQRGYRWSDTEAELMLEDFKEFCKRVINKKTDVGEFYCLQPIVVKARKWDDAGKPTEYEVIDGQQRLTTIYIILKCVEQIREILFDDFKMYTIKYETRVEYDSQKFLETIDAPERDPNDYIDFYYMKKVYDSVCAWFKRPENKEIRNKIVNALLEHNIDEETGADLANNIRFIWYEVADENNETSSSNEIFRRLNIGKIPLTNAELIKALFMRKGNFVETESSMRQLQIASEWNLIEQRLQDDSFWYFIYSSNWPIKTEYENRIEFIFDLMKKRTKESEFYYTFKAFNKELESMADTRLSEQAKVEMIWLSIKKVFQTLEEWYQDRTLYHYIGFLIEYGVDINELKDQSLKLNKKDFLSHIKAKIKGLLRGVKLDELSYGDSNVKKVLLLFNILTVLQTVKSEMRFPFNKYKTDKWDIEHISSQTDKKISDEKQRRAWLEDMFDFFVGDTDHEKIDAYITTLDEEIKTIEDADDSASKSAKLAELREKRHIIKNLRKIDKDAKINETEFDEAFYTVCKYCGEDKFPNKDFIYNLTLLDAETNRGYGNAFFPIKRKKIIGNDMKGIFVPIVTKNAFLKYYSRTGDNIMFWTGDDANDYFDAMEALLADYLN